VSSGLDDVRAELDCQAATIEFTQTVLGTRPQEFCLLCILLEAVCRHPVIDICDTVFKFPNSSRHIIATTTLIQLRIVSKSVIVDAVLISLLFEISSVLPPLATTLLLPLVHTMVSSNSLLSSVPSTLYVPL